MTAALPYDSPALAWLQAAARAADWFAARLGPGGRLPPDLHDLGSYYKWPLFLHALGRADLARAVYDRCLADFFTADGDFRSGQAKSADPIYSLIADSYTNTWLIAAARLYGQGEVGRLALDCLRRRQVARTGGFLTGRPGDHPEQRQDIVTIAGCGNAFLAWGELEPALQAGDCLLRVLASQQQAPDFCFYIDGEGRLLRHLDLPPRLLLLQPALPGQAYVYPGMTALFLARLYLASGEARFLAGAQGYFALQERCGEAMYQGFGCCKTGWCAAVLARITGDERYRRSVHRAAAAILAVQHPTGEWPVAGASAMLACDVTGEMGYHLTHYALELAGGPR
ncbi:MAG: hypothetical protein IT369_00820 [Candidatus Latescibacteria bacterium]|nr:hypothetical protein [Candidatus Latescibacterota bacterium]